MKKAYFPMFVDISMYKIIVVGGGSIATRRVKTLVQFADTITVIAPKISDELRELETTGEIHCVSRAYEESDIEDADMVLAATNDRELNRYIAKRCRESEAEWGKKILLSVADDRALCDFYFPAVLQKNDITIGINSGGTDPGRVKKIRRELEGLMKDEFDI